MKRIINCHLISFTVSLFLATAGKIRSRERVDRFGDSATEAQIAPFVTPAICFDKGCCYDDMYMSEPDTLFDMPPGRTWCFKKREARSPLRGALCNFQLCPFGPEKIKFLKLSQMNGLDKRFTKI